jgi:formylglycine-generating enzyme required for sulfatase activity
MYTNKIDWVEIPAGEFQAGISEEQAEILRRMARRHHGAEPMDERTRQLIEQIHRKRKPQTRFTDQERAILRHYRYIFRIESFIDELREQPMVELGTFYIARFRVTEEQWAAYCGTSPRRGQLKVPYVATWGAADWFCRKLGGRLPTEMEWEKAARGVEGYLYPWGNEWDPSQGNFTKDVHAPGQVGGTWKSEVDAYPNGVSPYGVWDMCGSVMEWTMTDVPPADDDNGRYIIKKGYPVKWESEAPWFDYLAITVEVGMPPDAFYTGFRPVLERWVPQQWTGFTPEEKADAQEQGRADVADSEPVEPG